MEYLLEHQEVHLVVEPVDDAVEDEQLPGGPAMHQLVQQHVALHQEHRGQKRTGAWLGSGLGLGSRVRVRVRVRVSPSCSLLTADYSLLTTYRRR